MFCSCDFFPFVVVLRKMMLCCGGPRPCCWGIYGSSSFYEFKNETRIINKKSKEKFNSLLATQNWSGILN